MTPKWYRKDTETNLIIPGLLAPEIICEQFAVDGGPVVVRSHVEPGFLSDFASALDDPDTIIEGHNLAYDLAVIAAHRPDLVQPIFRMLAQGRGRDTMLLEQLKRVADGTIQRNDRGGKIGLGALVAKYCGYELDKGEEAFRTRYATLKGLPASDYPVEALKYAVEDVSGLRDLSKTLRERFSSPDEWFQVAASFALHLCAVWGMRVDGDTLSWVEVSLLTKKEEAERILEKAGFFREGSVNRKAVQAAVEEAYTRILKLPVPKSDPSKTFPQGQTKYDADTIEVAAEAFKKQEGTEGKHPMVYLSDHQQVTRNLSTYLEPMKYGIIGPMNSSPNTIVATGRTSWGGRGLDLLNPWRDLSKKWKAQEVTVGTGLQNQPQEAGIRDLFVPRPGYMFSSTDYSALELRTLAQACLWITGRSTLADGFRSDPKWDPHCYFASQLLRISYTEAMTLHKTGDKPFKEVRQVAKNLNFSFPGGVGARKIQTMLKGAGIERSLDECYFYKEQWLEAFPEMVDYFEYVNYLSNNGLPFRQFVSGRIRGDIGFNDGCNSPFQGLGGDISKYALFLVSMACYAEPESPLFGSRPLVLVHDEILAEHPREKASPAVLEVERLMCVAESVFLPDVPAAAEPTLMPRWMKEAKLIKNDAGEVLPWGM